MTMTKSEKAQIATFMEVLTNVANGLLTLRDAADSRYAELSETAQETKRGEKLREFATELDDAHEHAEALCAQLKRLS